jgi:hypothetical protein
MWLDEPKTLEAFRTGSSSSRSRPKELKTSSIPLRLEENINTVGRLYYSASTTICVAHSLPEGTGVALGAQAGEKRLAQPFRKAGYSSFRRASETPFNLILEARA